MQILKIGFSIFLLAFTQCLHAQNKDNSDLHYEKLIQISELWPQAESVTDKLIVTSLLRDGVARLAASDLSTVINLVSVDSRLISEDFRVELIEALAHHQLAASLRIFKDELKDDSGLASLRREALTEILVHGATCGEDHRAQEVLSLLNSKDESLKRRSFEFMSALAVALLQEGRKLTLTKAEIASLRTYLDSRDPTERVYAAMILAAGHDLDSLADRLSRRSSLQSSNFDENSYPLIGQLLIVDAIGTVGGPQCARILTDQIDSDTAHLKIRENCLLELVVGTTESRFDITSTQDQLLELVRNRVEDTGIRQTAVSGMPYIATEDFIQKMEDTLKFIEVNEPHAVEIRELLREAVQVAEQKVLLEKAIIDAIENGEWIIEEGSLLPELEMLLQEADQQAPRF